MATGTLWNETNRGDILRRFEQLSPDARPKWGQFNAPRMLTHVTDAVRSGLGEVTPLPIQSPLRYWPINVFAMFYAPWPRGVATSPELLSRVPAEWPREIVMLKNAVGRFVARDVNGPWARHVAFGNISGRHWGRLMYRHMDYHLGQFGG